MTLVGTPRAWSIGYPVPTIVAAVDYTLSGAYGRAQTLLAIHEVGDDAS